MELTIQTPKTKDHKANVGLFAEQVNKISDAEAAKCDATTLPF